MGWAFYQLSGGAEFDPVATRNARIDGPPPVETTTIASATPVTQEVEETVTRVSLDLASLEDVLTPAQRGLVGRTERARERLQPVAEVEEEKQELILPSLIENAVPSQATVTPVDFSPNQVAAAPVANPNDVRSVTGNRVNVRGGPGTTFGVVNKLVRGDQVEVLEDPGNGWVMLRPVNGGPVGWMADFLLSGS